MAWRRISSPVPNAKFVRETIFDIFYIHKNAQISAEGTPMFLREDPGECRGKFEAITSKDPCTRRGGSGRVPRNGAGTRSNRGQMERDGGRRSFGWTATLQRHPAYDRRRVAPHAHADFAGSRTRRSRDQDGLSNNSAQGRVRAHRPRKLTGRAIKSAGGLGKKESPSDRGSKGAIRCATRDCVGNEISADGDLRLCS